MEYSILEESEDWECNPSEVGEMVPPPIVTFRQLDEHNGRATAPETARLPPSSSVEYLPAVETIRLRPRASTEFLAKMREGEDKNVYPISFPSRFKGPKPRKERPRRTTSEPGTQTVVVHVNGGSGDVYNGPIRNSNIGSRQGQNTVRNDRHDGQFVPIYLSIPLYR